MDPRLPIPGGDVGQWGLILNDYLSVAHNSDGSLKGTSVSGAGAEMTANKGTASGYAPLDTNSKVPAANLGGTGGDSTTFLRGDQTWAAVPAGADATTTSKGIVQLAGDLGGTAVAPTVPGLASKANTSTTISAGTGLTGGGDLSANRTLTVSYGTTAGTAAQGNDSRITGAVQKSVATTKGDLLAATASATIARLGVGTNNFVLTADSTQTTGLKWAAAPVTSVASKTGAVTLAESDITNLTTDLAATEKTANKGAANGYMGLDANSRGAQNPKLHASTHQTGGADALDFTTINLRGTLANMNTLTPATYNGQYYLATDTGGGTIYYSNGTSWIQAAKAVNGSTTAQPTANTPGTSVTVGTSSTQIAAANAGRLQIYIYNDNASNIVYLSLGGTAVVGQGARVNPNGDYFQTTVYTGAIFAIATGTGTNVMVTEI